MPVDKKILIAALKNITAYPNVKLGLKGTDDSYQNKFDDEVSCVHCSSKARLAFVMKEKYIEDQDDTHLCDLYENHDGGKLWPHDLTSFAIYLCGECLEPTAKFNQA